MESRWESAKLPWKSFPKKVLLHLDLAECLGHCRDKKRYGAFFAEREGQHIQRYKLLKDLECLRTWNFHVIGQYVCGANPEGPGV